MSEEISIGDIVVEDEVQINNLELDAYKSSVAESSYIGKISEADWEEYGKRYSYTITQSVHNLTNVYVVSYNVEQTDGYENAFHSYKILPNGNVLFISDIKNNVKFILKGAN